MKRQGQGVVDSKFIINSSFWFFKVCFGVVRGGMKIAIPQWLLVVGDCQARILCIILWENIGKSSRGRGIVERKFIINIHLLLLLYFSVGGDFAILIAIS